MKNPWQNARACYKELVDKLPGSTTISVNHGTEEEIVKYYKNARIFNRRLQRNPFIIVYCESSSDVQTTYKTAVAHNLPIRVRGGGHDHEGESSGTNTVLIDLSKMNTVEVDPTMGIAKIGPGNRFIKLTTDLAKKDVMIAHGTCATVCIAGFTLGGGWGPWTRKMGMNCEHLVGATLMLGNGELVDVDVKDGKVPDLLWALRGGGGMSYGIVTEFRIQTFPLPEQLIKFEIEWNTYFPPKRVGLIQDSIVPTIKILKAWEGVIKSADTSQLIGTNLKVNGKSDKDGFDINTVYHNSVMYGYWEGTKKSLEEFVTKHFGDLYHTLTIDGEGGIHPEHPHLKNEYGRRSLMSAWDRESLHKVQKQMIDRGLLQGEPIPPDLDQPAPHKITSRLVNQEGLSEKGYEQLLRSLTSHLISEENRPLGLFTYITLGAIVGDYYRTHPDGDSAFPYKDKLYTIQYQTWWNTTEEDKKDGQDSNVYDHTNRALDWMEVCRDFDIPNTSGAFISFKDASIPTEVYFDKSYERLKKIKMELCKDPHNHFRTRKTII
ncbi:MAG: FAD-binding protein [Bacteroidota bacterium]